MSAGDRVNFSGDVVDAAPTGGTTRGLIYNIQDAYLVARETQSATVDCVFALHGAVEATKLTGTGESFAIGDLVYFDGTSKATPNPTGGTKIGIALADATTSDTAVSVFLGNVPG